MPGETKSKDDSTTSYKEKCKTLKRKLRFLVHEQECFQEELRKAQRKLLKVSRDKHFLLDRLLQYEKVIFSGSDSEPTDSSDEEKPDPKKPSQVNEAKDVPAPKPKVKRKPKRKPAKKLQTNPKLGPGKTVLPVQIQSPPSSLKQHMPQLVEMLNRASAASVGAVSPDAFAGLPYTPAYGLTHLPNPGHLSQVFDQLPPSTTTSVLPSLLMSPHFPRLNMMRNLPHGPPPEPTPRKKVRRDSVRSQSSTPRANKSETQQPAAPPKVTNPQEPPESKRPNGANRDDHQSSEIIHFPHQQKFF